MQTGLTEIAGPYLESKGWKGNPNSFVTWWRDVQGFRVGEGFPRLTRAAVPTAIVDAAYTLDERQLGPFRVSTEELRSLVRQMSGLS
jgi:hypothetical protein